MIALITTCDPQRLYLLPAFVDHYRACGVEAFYISLHFDSVYAPEAQPEHTERVNAILHDLGLRLHAVYACPYDAAAVRRHHDRVQQQIAGSSPWIVWADIDEFHEFSDHLSSLTAHMRAHDVDLIEGRFVDRMARAGLPEFRGGVSPWRQFPLGTDITRTVLGGWAAKIMLSCSSARIAMGNHTLTAPQGARRMSGIYPVHHFKWDASVVPRLERRLADDWKQRCHWWPENERALKWINAGRWQRFEGLGVYDFEDDRRLDGGGPLSGSMRYLSNQARAALGARVPLE